MSKPDAIMLDGAFSLLPPNDKYKSYRIKWYDNTKRQTVSLSTGTVDLETAKAAFRQHVLINSQQQLKDEPLFNSCTRYHLKYGKNLASADGFLQAQAAAMEVLTDPAKGEFGPLVSEMGVALQEKLIEAWRAKGKEDSTILRWLGCLWAAMNYAAERQFINPTVVPKRLSAKRWNPHLRKRTKVLTTQQLAALLDAACLVVQDRNELYLIAPRGKYTEYRVGWTALNTQKTSRRSLGTTDPAVAKERMRDLQRNYNQSNPVTATESYDGVGFRLVLSLISTAAREAALRDLIMDAQVDHTHGIVHLNPEGRKQTKKFRPIIPMAPTFQKWLEVWKPLTPEGHLLGNNGAKLYQGHDFFDTLTRRTGIKCTAYTIRHTVSTWMASRVPSPWERDQFMGWMRSEGAAMGANYNHYDPLYLREASDSVQGLLEAIAVHMVGDLLRRGVQDQPLPLDDQGMAWIDSRLAGGFSCGTPGVEAVPPPVEAEVVGAGGVEPPTSCLSSKHSTAELRALPEDPNPPFGGLDDSPAWHLRGAVGRHFEEKQALIVPNENHVKV